MADGPSAAVHRMLSKIVQTFVALATPPLCYLYPSQVLADLDSIAQCNILLTLQDLLIFNSLQLFLPISIFE
jgi:hypothetical protein